MSSEKVWASQVKKKHETPWYDYNLSLENKFNGRVLLQYKEAPIFSEEEKFLKPAYDQEIKKYIAFIDKYDERERINIEDQPDRFYKMPDVPLLCDYSIFMAKNAFIFVNEATAQILKQHHLGNTRLIKVDPYDAVSGEPIRGECSLYLLHIAEAYECCRLEESKNIRWRINMNNITVPDESLEPVEDGYVIDTSILNSKLDMWMDSRLSETIFISDKLKSALDIAGFSSDWFFLSGLKI